MSQQPQSAKRMRSNTSNEFTPQTAPALRGRPSQQHLVDDVTLAQYSPSLNVNVYDGGFTAIPSTRQDVAYSSYVSTNHHNDYPAVAYGEPYDPLPHANSYTIAHGLPPPSDYNAAFGGYYSPDIVSNIQNAPYSPVTARNSTSTGVETFSPSPIPGSSAATSLSDLQGHSTGSVAQHALSQQFDDVYGSQPVSHPTTHHAQTLSYPDAVVNSQYTPPSETVINSQYNVAPPTRPGAKGHHQSPALPELDGDDSDEDAQGETADEADSSGIIPSPIPHAIPGPSLKRSTSDEPSKSSEPRCACKKGRGKKKACTSCACSRYGRKCGKLCSCGPACGNPFRDLTAFFGPPDKFPKTCDANPCFATWLSNQPNIEELDVDLMVDMLLYDDASWASIKKQNKIFKDWEDKWLKAKNSKSKKLKEDRERLEFELLRGALGNCNPNDFYGFWYSFCRGQWVPMDDWEHCRECKACAPSNEWHCEQHNRCTTNGTCAGCTGNTSYPELASYPVAV